MDEGLRMALGLALGLVILVLMITKTKIHVFLAVIICSILIGLFGGMGPVSYTHLTLPTNSLV